jgi:serine/threonine protein kinase
VAVGAVFDRLFGSRGQAETALDYALASPGSLALTYAENASVIGKTLAHYRIVEKIGAGGMGEVYRAVDTRLDRTVALKILPGHFSSDPELRQRFEREARVISNLSHPHICTLHDIGREEEIDFLVMEYLEGETLSERLSRGRLPAADVLRSGAEIAEALAAAHQSGIVHRDLKPGNVMLTATGVKLLDFGLAKIKEPQAREAAGASALRTEALSKEPLTERGTVLGTFRYMAPEQLEGREADERTDIFALGAVLYEMATGSRAFGGESQASLIAAIMERDPPSLSAVEPMTPPALDWTVRKCLAKDPADRWQSAGDIASEIRWIAEEGSQAGIPLPISRRRRTGGRLAWTLAAVSALSVLVLGVLYLRSASRDVRVVRASILPPENTEFYLYAGSPGPVSVSPDGRRLAFAAKGKPGDLLLYVRELDSPAARALPGTEDAAYPFWSPDGRTIGYFADGKLKRIDIEGGVPSSLCDAPNGKGGTWNSEGAILFAPAHDTPIHRVPAMGGEPRAVTELDSSRSEDSHRFPVFLADGRSFLYLARTTAVGKLHAVRIGRLDQESDELLFHAESNAAVASGHVLYLQEGTLMARPFDERNRRLAGAAFPLAEEVRFLPIACLGVFSASRDGVLVYQPGDSSDLTQLVWLDRSGERLGVLGEPAEHDWDAPRISPDERFVAVAIRSPRLGTHDVWTYDVVRGLRTRLTFDPADETSPVWSPDGRFLAFSSNRRGYYDLYRISVGKPDSEELLLETSTHKTAGCWSPDGRFLVYVSEDDLWMLPMSGQGDPIPLVSSEFEEARPCFSPDGQWLAYSSTETGRYEVFAISFPQADRKWQISVSGGMWPMWTDQDLAYVQLDGFLQAVTVRTKESSLVIGAPETLYDVSDTRGGTTTHDGQKALCFLPVKEGAAERLNLVVHWTAGLEHP